MFPQYDPVCVLLETPFSRWTKEDQNEFVSYERPQPTLNVNKSTTVKGKLYVRHFKELWYTRYGWLCGSYYLNKLFCLPCLVISTKTAFWNKDGFNDFGNANRAFHKHECSVEHMRSSLAFNRLLVVNPGLGDALKENTRLYTKHFNENVRLNRLFMELPIRAVIYLGKQELAFGGQEESSVNRGNFKELINSFIAISSFKIKEHYQKIKPVFTGNLKRIENELIDCITGYIDDHIEKEINDCDFFSIQVDDTTDITQISQCCIIIRFVSKGELVERFLGHYNVSSDRTTESLFDVLFTCLGKYDYKTKLVGQCYDGASVMAEQLNGLQAKVKEAAPQALFVQFHRLSLVLQQSCYGISKCRIFFANLSGIPEFFRHSAKRTYLADTVIGSRIPQTFPARWSSNSKILDVINNEWDSLKQVFCDIVNDPNSDQISIRQSTGFLNNFNDFEFAILVLVFSDICLFTDILFDALQNDLLDINYCISQIKTTQALLNKKRHEDSFKEIFDKAVSRTPIPTTEQEKGSRSTLEDQVFKKYQVLYYEILDTISLQITTRFQDFEKFQFITLMDTSKFKDYSKNFPTDTFTNIKECYPYIFTETQKLQAELQFIWANDELKHFEPKTLMKYITENKNIFQEVYKLFSLIMTITSISVERNLSCIKKVKMHLRRCVTGNGLTNLSKISIEKELLDELMATQPFFDDIIDEFASLENRRFELIYKKTVVE